jgi:TetR/AcrR family transcriptional regulator, regulator of cefoperazone and chloramphenicol sensitivity
VSLPTTADTKGRLLAAAAELFAARGFHSTTMRDIAARARVNLAASNYHYGSKKALYLAVLRAQFAEIHTELRRRGAPASQRLVRLGHNELVELLHTRGKVMLDLLIGPPPGLHGTLMQREMSDPSDALPVIVKEFVLPMVRDVEQIVAQLTPGLSRRDVERCAFSIMGQALFYRFAMPATLKMWGVAAYPHGLSRALAKHITQFSLGGLERLAARAPKRRSGGRRRTSR